MLVGKWEPLACWATAGAAALALESHPVFPCCDSCLIQALAESICKI